jgi:hypothetical protein
MTGDHHGRTAGRATPLVTATNEILGTHKAGDHVITAADPLPDELRQVIESVNGSS